MNVVPLPVVRDQKSLHMTPRALYGFCVGACTLVNGANVTVNGAVRVTFRVEIPVCTLAITDDRSAGFDPVTYDSHQCVSGSLPYGNEKCSAGLSFNTSEHPLTLNRVSPVILSPTELAFINLDGLLRTTNLSRAALQKHQHGFPSEHAPLCDRMCTQAKFVLDLVGLFGAHDVVHDE